MSEAAIVHVAVGVLRNANNEVLVTRRHDHLHQGGLLEFPGGKLEPGEDRFAGLQREFLEELGLQVTAAYPLKKITHHYADKSVLLDVWLITEFIGVAEGLEGQPVYWLPVQELDADQFPAANKRIVDILKLPEMLAITPDFADWSQLQRFLEASIARGAGMILLRQKEIDARTYERWYESAHAYCSAREVRLMHNRLVQPDSEVATELTVEGIDGVHCTSATLMSLKQRPVSRCVLFSASCHSLEELLQAEALDADFVLLSPVLPTAKYSEHQLLGWEGFSALRARVSLPVIALGGITGSDLNAARSAGAQGLAGIRLFIPAA